MKDDKEKKEKEISKGDKLYPPTLPLVVGQSWVPNNLRLA